MTKLEEFIKDNIKGNNVVNMFISERGNQRIEITDTDTNEIWQTLESVGKQDDIDDFSDIQDAIISAIIQQSE